jgi:transcriptional regulator with XRE-family HTH domain
LTIARRPALADTQSRAASGPGEIGKRIREERLRQSIGVRELARRVGVSAGLISQVELGRASPSVGTLYAIVNVLGLSLDKLLLDQSSASAPVSRAARKGVDPVVRQGEGRTIQLASGVTWERLTPRAPQDVDFVSVIYEVGGESCPEDSPVRHSGSEYGHVLAGRLGVTVGLKTYELGPRDSISFESTRPHRLFNAGDELLEAIWFVVGRRGDPRISGTLLARTADRPRA